jgi:hypothetical protein
MSPPKKHLGWIVGGGMAGLAMAVAAFWYLFIAPAAVPVLPVVPSITATPIKPE